MYIYVYLIFDIKLLFCVNIKLSFLANINKTLTDFSMV